LLSDPLPRPLYAKRVGDGADVRDYQRRSHRKDSSYRQMPYRPGIEHRCHSEKAYRQHMEVSYADEVPYFNYAKAEVDISSLDTERWGVKTARITPQTKYELSRDWEAKGVGFVIARIDT